MIFLEKKKPKRVIFIKNLANYFLFCLLFFLTINYAQAAECVTYYKGSCRQECLPDTEEEKTGSPNNYGCIRSADLIGETTINEKCCVAKNSSNINNTTNTEAVNAMTIGETQIEENNQSNNQVAENNQQKEEEIKAETLKTQTTIYKNKEKIPGQDSTDKFTGYLNNLYKFGIAISAILAFAMISYAAFIMMISGVGNASKVMDAKSMITDAIIGLLLALTAYLILYVINPDLLKGSSDGFSATVDEKEAAAASKDGKSGTSRYLTYIDACPNGKFNKESKERGIDYSKSNKNKEAFKKQCGKYTEIFNKYETTTGLNSKEGFCVLKVIAHLESRCGEDSNTQKPLDPDKKGGDDLVCGFMQMKKGTFNSLGFSGSCEDLIAKGPVVAIEAAAKYISKNSSSWSAVGEKNKIAAIFAGYNSGYATTGKGGLATSNDCGDQYKKFECCYDPGELDQSIAYAWSGMDLYNQCMK